MYYVIHGATITIATPHLLDALATWLALASSDGHLKLGSLRAPWAECIAHLPLADALFMPA
jgi:hypothetical protein